MERYVILARMSVIIAPSVLSADFARLHADIEMINSSRAGWIHIDVMDGVFVPNISFGFPVLKAIRRLTTKWLDVHLMIVQPERYIREFRDAGADLITVHYEAVTHLDSVIHQIKNTGAQAGVALNPATPVTVLSHVAPLLDLVLIMSVNPGFGGQQFIPYAIQKVAALRTLLRESGSSAKIEVDGGVGTDNARALCEAGADVLVAGNAIFGSANPTKTIEEMLQSCTSDRP
ncbi:MAG: ribulose-phosphate 3-epimerase [Chitinophagales bacterium]|nr:ribulose-phosphate 3-epimerase [Chitinophagales bacterium]